MTASTMTARAWSRVAFIVFMAIVIQLGVLDGLSVHGAHADVFVLLAVVAGLAAGPQQGAVIAFVVGLGADLFVLTPFGLSSLCFTLVAFAFGMLATVPGGRAPNSYRLIAAVAGGVVETLLFAALGALIGQPSLPHHQLFAVVAVVAAGNAILAIPAFGAMTWALRAGAPAHDLAGVSGGSALR